MQEQLCAIQVDKSEYEYKNQINIHLAQNAYTQQCQYWDCMKLYWATRWLKTSKSTCVVLWSVKWKCDIDDRKGTYTLKETEKATTNTIKKPGNSKTARLLQVCHRNRIPHCILALSLITAKLSVWLDSVSNIHKTKNGRHIRTTENNQGIDEERWPTTWFIMIHRLDQTQKNILKAVKILKIGVQKQYLNYPR